MDKLKDEFLRLVDIVNKLRHPEQGCPWDIKQTHLSLIPYLIEESYEVIEALESGEDLAIVEELGDLLLQVLLHARIAEEEARFNLEKVLITASEKLIRRHPHVFGDLKLASIDEVLQNWEKIKLAEGQKKEKQGILSGVPQSLPALLRAERMGEKSKRIGLDWQNSENVLPKIKEELQEFEESLNNVENSPELASAEFGDLLFSLVQYARKIGIDSERSLQQSCNKFSKRVAYIENHLTGDPNEADLDALWKQAKESVG